MIPFRRKAPKADPDTARGVGRALREAYDDPLDEHERAEDARMQSLIDQMKRFEGTQDGDSAAAD